MEHRANPSHHAGLSPRLIPGSSPRSALHQLPARERVEPELAIAALGWMATLSRVMN